MNRDYIEGPKASRPMPMQSAEPDITPIPAALNAVDSALGFATDRLNELESRLHMVLLPNSPEVGGKNSVKAISEAPLTESLNTLAGRADYLGHRINDILSRLHL